MSFGRLRLPRVRPIAIAVAVAILLALGGGWFWLRDSSLVAVQRVTVIGASGPDAGQIRASLVVAGRGMTTLDVNMSALRTAVSPFPVIKDLRASTQFPHGLLIKVIEQIPVAALTANGERIAVAGDGTLLRDVQPALSLPAVTVRVLPVGRRVTDPAALGVLAVLRVAPWQLLAHVAAAGSSGQHGVVVELRQGPRLYFGDPTLLAAKWSAADGVIADPGSQGAAYIDVSDPYRPAAGATSGSGGASSAAAGATSARRRQQSATGATALGAASSPGTGSTAPGAASSGGNGGV